MINWSFLIICLLISKILKDESFATYSRNLDDSSRSLGILAKHLIFYNNIIYIKLNNKFNHFLNIG